MTMFYAPLRGLQAAVENIITLNDQMTSLSRVTEMTGDKMQSFLQESIALADELSVSVTNLNEAVIGFSRMGYRGQDLLNMAEAASIMSGVSDLTLDESMSRIVSAMQTFGIESEQVLDRVVSSINEVDNNFAITTADLSDGLAKAGSTARAFGADINFVLGNLTAIGESSRESGRIIGNALKTIYSRITTLNKSREILKSVGISIKDMNGEVRDVSDILTELAGKWNNLTREQQQNIGVTVAGRYQLSRFLLLMQNFERSQQATKAATDSMNSAQNEYQKYLDSYTAKIEKMKNAFIQLSVSLEQAFLGDALRLGIEMTTGLVKYSSDLVNEIGLLPPVFGAASTAVLLFNDRLRTVAINSGALFIKFLKGVPSGLRTIESAMAGATIKTRAFAVASNTASIAVKGLRTALIGTMRFLAGAILPVAGFVALGYAISKVTEKVVEYRKEQQKLKQQQEDLIKSYRNNKEEISSLVSEYKKLDVQRERLSSEQEKRYYEISSKLNDLLPTLTDRIDTKGRVHLKSAEAIDKEIDRTKELVKAQNELEKATSAETLETGQDELEKYRRQLNRINEKINFYKTSNFDEEDIQKELAELELKRLNTQKQLNSAIKDYNNSLNDTVALFADVELSDQLKSDLDYLFNSQFGSRENFIQYEDLDKQIKTIKDFGNKLKEIAQVRDVFDDTFSTKEIIGFDKDQITVINAISDASKTGYENWDEFARSMLEADFTGKQVIKMLELLKGKTQDNTNTVDEQVQSYEELQKILNDSTDTIGTYNDLLKKVSEGKKISAEEALNLIKNEKGLAEAIEIENGIVKVNADIVQQARDIKVQSSIDALEAKRNEIGEKLKLYQLDIEGITSVAKAQQMLAEREKEYADSTQGGAVFATMSNRLAKEYKDDIERIAALNDQIKILKTQSDKIGISSEKDTSKSPSSRDFRDPTQAQINEIANQQQILKNEEEKLKSQIEIAKQQENYNKQLELTNKLIENQKEQINAIGSTNATSTILNQLHQIANQIRQESGYTAEQWSQWFDGSQLTDEFDKFYNTLSSEAQDSLLKHAKNIQSAKKAYEELNSSRLQLVNNQKQLTQSLKETTQALIYQNVEQRQQELLQLKNELSTLNLKANVESDEKTLNNIESRIAEFEFKVVEKLNDNIKKAIQDRARLVAEGLDTTQIDQKIQEYTEERLQRLANAREKLLKKFQEQFQKTLTDSQQNIDNFTNSIELLNDKIELLSDSDFDEKINLTKQALEENKSKADELVETYYELRDTEVYTQEDAEKLRERLNELKKELRDTNKQSIEYVRSLEQIQFQKITQDANKAQDEIERLSKRVNDNLEMLEGGMLSGTELSFDFTMPSGNTLDLESLIEDPISDIQDEEIKIQDIRAESHKRQLDETEEFYMAMLNSSDTFYNDLQQSVEQHNNTVENEEKNKNDRLLASLDMFTVMYQDQYGSHLDNIKENTKNTIDQVVNEYERLKDIEIDTPNTSTGGNSNRSSSNPKVDIGAGFDAWREYQKWKEENSYAKGTDKNGHGGGLALVGEEGQELVILPNGQLKLTGDKGTELHNLPKGTHVIPNKETEQILKSQGIKGYADGTGANLFSEDLIRKATEEISYAERDRREYEEEGSGLSTSPYSLRGRRYDDDLDKENIIYFQYHDGYDTDSKRVDLNDLTKEEIESLITSRQEVEDIFGNTKKVDFDFLYDKDKEKFINYVINHNKEIIEKEMKIREEQQNKFAEILSKGTERYNKSLDDINEEISDFQSRYEQLNTEIDQARISGNEQDVLDAVERRNTEIRQNTLQWNTDLLKESEEIARETVQNLTEYMNENELTEEMQQRVREEIQRQNDIINNSIIQRKKAIKDYFDYEQSLRDKNLQEIKDKQDDIQFEIDLIKDINPNNLRQLIGLNEKLVDSSQNYYNKLVDQRDTIQEQMEELEVGSYEWNLLNDKVSDYNEKIEDSLSLLVRQRRELVRTQLNQQLSQIEQEIFSGKTQEDAKKELEEKVDQQEKFLSGLEKEIEISKLRSFVRRNNLSLSEDELRILNQRGKIERKSIERLQKQLEIRRLEQKLQNLQNERNIQELIKTDDGFQFKYVANQDEIDKTQEELQEARLDLINWEKDIEIQRERDMLNERVDYFNKLEDITRRALNGEIDSYSDFTNEISKLNSNFLNNLDLENKQKWESIFNTIKDNLDITKNYYKDYLSDLKQIADNAERHIQRMTSAKQEDYKDTQNNNSSDNSIINKTPDSINLNGVDYNYDEWKNLSRDRRMELYNDAGGMDNVTAKFGNKTYTIREILDKKMEKFDTGGYTGNFDGGKLALLHEKELVLNPDDTKNILKSVNMVRDFASNINLPNMKKLIKTPKAQEIIQKFNIDKLEFPNVRSSEEIQKALISLPKIATQRVNQG